MQIEVSYRQSRDDAVAASSGGANRRDRDGRVFVIPVGKSYRIRTGERARCDTPTDAPRRPDHLTRGTHPTNLTT